MPSYSKSTPEALRRKLGKLEEELAQAEPALVKEIQLVKELLIAAESETSKTYAHLTTPVEAINLCLNINGDYKLSQKEMLSEILHGGYIGRRPKAARGLLNDSINHHKEIGYLSEKAGLIGRPNPKREPTRRR